jgi:hypothetical protein
VTIAGSVTLRLRKPDFVDAFFSYDDLQVPPSGYPVRAEIPGHDPQTLEAFVVANATDALDYALAPRTWGVVSGTITDASTGQPIRLAEVRVEGSALLAAASEGDGTYDLLAVPEGTHAIEIVHPEYLTAHVASVAVSDGGTTPLSAALTKRPITATLAGTLTDALTGVPIAGATLVIASGPSTTTDASGH